ncbi:hypothetical protein D3Y57_19000 [Sphingomonas paeninsulae]|uniref:Uncharacterized protein n=1 Tax=Sphingomonas paeninsulae TaxID=2319844 RepID=A0A494TR77_SPHPE|nr:hypothetical protein [Sphingomonas paeninsulae]AYJ87625.1 hypothetical protein D3Y57_19000 [Sphingomonas paeninsulae]
MTQIYDKTGRSIAAGDVLKVYHFTGARWRKRHFMFKQVMRETTLGKNENAAPYFFVSHLTLTPEGERDSGYYLALDGKHHADIEIVQGLVWHHDRPRVAAPASSRAPDWPVAMSRELAGAGG